MQNKSNQYSIFICNVYGTNHYRDKLDLWDSLLSLNSDLQRKYIIIAGDFNTMKSSLEQRGGSITRDPFGENMEYLMEYLNLLDPMPKNGK